MRDDKAATRLFRIIPQPARIG